MANLNAANFAFSDAAEQPKTAVLAYQLFINRLFKDVCADQHTPSLV